MIKIKSKLDNEYIFDNNSGQIFNINDTNEHAVLKEYNNKLGIYPVQSINKITESEIKDFLITKGNGFHQLILEVTSQCNFRCKYCCYSDFYPYTHGYANDFMEETTAFKTIDLFFENFKKAQLTNPLLDPFIGFYGGEPLLNLDLIKKSVAYIENKYEIYKPKYNITTNGYLLTEESIEYFVQKDFALLISLDGYSENHDRNRVTHDNKPTFDIVFKKYKFIQSKYPEYKKLSISFCYDLKTDLIKVKHFFEKNKIDFFRASSIESVNTDYYEQFSEEDVAVFQRNYTKLKDEFFECVKQRTLTSTMFVYNFFCAAYLEMNYHCMIGDLKNTLIPYSGTCIPGQKLYVRPDGSIHICERVNPNFSIGNIEVGLDFNNIANIINDYNQKIGNKCSNCNTSKLCSNCFSKFFNDKEIVYNNNICEMSRTNHKEGMKDIINCMELNSELFDKITVNYYDKLLQKAIGGC